MGGVYFHIQIFFVFKLHHSVRKENGFEMGIKRKFSLETILPILWVENRIKHILEPSDTLNSSRRRHLSLRRIKTFYLPITEFEVAKRGVVTKAPRTFGSL